MMCTLGQISVPVSTEVEATKPTYTSGDSLLLPPQGQIPTTEICRGQSARPKTSGVTLPLTVPTVMSSMSTSHTFIQQKQRKKALAAVRRHCE